MRLFVGSVLAVVIPAAVLHFTADERRAAGLTASPFAWPRVLVAHLVTALPLGFLIAGKLRAVPALNETARGLWVGIGCGMAGLAVAVSPAFGEAIAAGGVDATVLLVLRALLAFGLVLPWCVFATDPRGERRSPGRPGLWFAVCAGLALVPCALYAEAIVAGATKSAEEWATTGRYARAERVLVGLVELGSDRPVAGKPPAELRRELRKELDRLERMARSPLAEGASPQARLMRAEVLIQLDRLDEAADLLRPLAAEHITATLLLAAVERDRGQWASSDELYEVALAELLPKADRDPRSRNMCRLCFDGLAYNARNDRRPADVERALQRGLEALPVDAAYFHFLLGQHYSNTGRPAPAIEHLTRATELDPASYRAPAERIIQHLRTATPGCALRRSN
jgi:hypothetical protein